MTNTNSVQNLINEVKATRGATVKVFGHPHEVPATIGKGLVDIIDILESFQGYEAETTIPAQYEVSEGDNYIWEILDNEGNVIETGFEDEEEAEDRMYKLQESCVTVANVEQFIEHMEDLGYLEEKSADNSYNWSGNVSNDFNFRTYQHIDGSFYVEFAAHLYGDVRANYTDSVLLKFDNDYAFHELLLESEMEEEYKGYNIRFSVTSEAYEIFHGETYECMDNKYSWDDAIEYIDGLVEEEIGEEV